jgi:hypothetical protein
VAASGLIEAVVSMSWSRHNDRSRSRNSAGAVIRRACIWLAIWVRIFTAERRAIRNEEIMPTRSFVFGDSGRLTG